MAQKLVSQSTGKEKEFATGCLVWIMKARNNVLKLDFLTSPEENRNSDEDSYQLCQIDLDEVRSLYREIYDTINILAAIRGQRIEEKYRSVFTEDIDVDAYLNKFKELVSLYKDELYEESLCYISIIEFCARVSVWAYMSYQEKELQKTVSYAVSSITVLLIYFCFDNSKYMELGACAEVFLKFIKM